MIKLIHEDRGETIEHAFKNVLTLSETIERFEMFLKAIGFEIPKGEYLGIRGYDEDEREPTVDDYVDLCDYRNVEDFLSDKPIEEAKAMINFGLGMIMDSKFRESAEQVLITLEHVTKK